MKQNADRLRQALSESHKLATRLDETGFPLAKLEYLQGWQRQRLANSYHDLISKDRFSAAGDFFLDEIYGGLHFRERDQEMERVQPVMVRMLRDDMLLVLAEAYEQQALSLDFDMEMTRAMLDSGWRTLDVKKYVVIYRAC